MNIILTDLQLEIFHVLAAICFCSFLFCFIVGELTLNNSQMDKLWSIMPPVYVWVIAAMGGMSLRLIVMAILATVWGARLTYNFGRKGAYSIKFWSGEEDYRWKFLRGTKYFKSRAVWALFDFLFISIYQNVLVLLTTLPALAAVDSANAFGWVDVLAAVLTASFILLETVADEQQWKFQTTKWNMINSGKKLEELPEPYNKGFNTKGLWAISRHPNYLGEQGTWCSFYIFSIGAGVGILNWSVIGAALLVMLFFGSAWLGEMITSSKYPAYADYKKKVSKFIPTRL